MRRIAVLFFWMSVLATVCCGCRWCGTDFEMKWIDDMKTECTLTTPKQYGVLELTDFRTYWEMLNCVPPRHRTGGRFAVGEASADRWQFGGEFPDVTAHYPVFECYFACESDGYDENDVYVRGYFTLKGYLALSQHDLRNAAATLRLVETSIGIGDQIQCVENNWQGRVTAFETQDHCTMLVCHHVSGGEIELDDKRWFDPRDVRLLRKAE